ncbi:hypothetical protein CHH57_01770 [Niallia circulans]|uniref:Uncharacterized protein n=1 Tax=Niallia circulans TaxID=1397 RepID=A0AA91TVK9_NIACI|nr:hypothetical protein [Niallia circulans]PAD85063.1 hypothetical protein CHH57_01770 [Niallia circulans]
MRKQSMMGSSKYEFSPEQIDKDIQNKIDKHQQLKRSIHNSIMEFISSEPHKMDQTFSTILEVMREIKQEYKL